MKLGIIARSEDRGLGLQTWEACRHLNPDRVLLVEPQPLRWPAHHDRYAEFDTTLVRWDGRHLDEKKCRRWLDGLDVVYTAETPYDQRLPQWAAEVRCGVAVHANPEMLNANDARNPYVTWWAPTNWRLGQLPFGTRVVPMPVATDRFSSPTLNTEADRSRLVTFVHSMGHEAVHDRNGTRLFADAVRQLDVACRVELFGQDGNLPKLRPRVGAPVEIDRVRGVKNYWEQYVNGDVLVMPRRYGGLCLPVQEAMAAGLTVVMTDVSPNRTWPGPRVPAVESMTMVTRCGEVRVDSCDPADLADVMTRLATDRGWLACQQAEARKWAETHSWSTLAPKWRKELTLACRR